MANVNRPTDVAQKEKDINQKLQLYGIYSAFALGKVPSNKQIDVALNSALKSKALSSPSGKLSEEGQKLVADLKEVIVQAKQLFLSKNQGNLLQDFIWDSQHFETSSARAPGAPLDKETAQQHGREATEGLKTLGTLIISNGQFRKLLSDATVLLRDMAGDAAQNAANKVNPSEDRLRQIDEPAADNTWHDVPDLSKENIKGQLQSTYDKNKPFGKEDVKQATQAGVDTAQAHPADPTQDTQQAQQAGQAGVGTTKDILQEKASQNIPEERKEDARQAKEAFVQSSRNYLNKKMPQERREQTIWRLKKMVVEIQGHSDYQQAIETLLSLAETYGGHAKTVSADSTGIAKGIHGDNDQLLVKFKTLIERFANCTSTDDLTDALNNIYRDADQDPELKNWFKSVDRFIRRCLQEQGFIMQEESDRQWDALYDKGRFLLRERYRDHTDRILDEIKFLADQFDQDPQNKAFGNAVQKLFLDLGNDEDGKATFKPHLIKDLTEVIIPGIFENTRYVPIPRIEVSDPMIDAVVENLVIESDNLFPNVFEFGQDNYFRLGRRQVANKNEHKIMIAASGIQCDLRDVAYYVKKKSGFPSITDKGVMDIILAGEGFSFKLAARNAQKKDRTHFVVVDKVDVTVHSLNIKVKKSNHKLLFNIAKPLLLKVMKPAIQKVIEKQIKQSFEQLDTFAYGIQQDAQRAVDSAKNDPENSPNIFQEYVNAYQKKMLAKKEAAKEKVSDTKVNVAVTKQDSMFKHISLPGGISTKATEYKELAQKGDRWESPVFGIGSAKESTDIPTLNKITRKPHQTAKGIVQGGNHPNSSTTSSLPGQTSGYAAAPGTTGYAAAPGTTGYGQTTGAGTGLPGSNLGASTAGTTTLPSHTVPTAGAGTTGFRNEVDQAFETKPMPVVPGGNIQSTNGRAL